MIFTINETDYLAQSKSGSFMLVQVVTNAAMLFVTKTGIRINFYCHFTVVFLAIRSEESLTGPSFVNWGWDLKGKCPGCPLKIPTSHTWLVGGSLVAAGLMPPPNLLPTNHIKCEVGIFRGKPGHFPNGFPFKSQPLYVDNWWAC